MSRPETIKNKMITLEGFTDWVNILRYELPRLGNMNTIINSEYCFCPGYNNQIENSSYSVIRGKGNQMINSHNCYIFGQECVLNEVTGTTLIGRGLVSTLGYARMIIGEYNDPNDQEDAAFVIGMGDSEDDRKNIFKIDNTGDVYITGVANVTGIVSSQQALQLGQKEGLINQDGKTIINSKGWINPRFFISNTTPMIWASLSPTLFINRNSTDLPSDNYIIPSEIRFCAGTEDSYANIRVGDIQCNTLKAQKIAPWNNNEVNFENSLSSPQPSALILNYATSNWKEFKFCNGTGSLTGLATIYCGGLESTEIRSLSKKWILNNSLTFLAQYDLAICAYTIAVQYGASFETFRGIYPFSLPGINTLRFWSATGTRIDISINIQQDETTLTKYTFVGATISAPQSETTISFIEDYPPTLYFLQGVI